MALILRNSQPLTQKPQRPVPVDWANPLTRGIKFACLDVGGQYVSLVRPGIALATSGTAGTLESFPHKFVGYGVKHNQTRFFYFPIASFPEIAFSGPITFAMVAGPTGNSTDNAGIAGRSANNGQSAPYANFFFSSRNGSSNWEALYNAGGGGLTHVAGVPGTLNAIYTAVCSIGSQNSAAFGGNNVALYQNGVKTGGDDLSTQITQTAAGSGGDDFIIGDYNGTTGFYEGFMAFYVVWNRQLSTAEVQAFTRDPYKLLKPYPSPERLALLAEAPATNVDLLSISRYTSGGVSIPLFNGVMASVSPSRSQSPSNNVPQTALQSLGMSNTAAKGTGVWTAVASAFSAFRSRLADTLTPGWFIAGTASFRSNARAAATATTPIRTLTVTRVQANSNRTLSSALSAKTAVQTKVREVLANATALVVLAKAQAQTKAGVIFPAVLSTIAPMRNAMRTGSFSLPLGLRGRGTGRAQLASSTTRTLILTALGAARTKLVDASTQTIGLLSQTKVISALSAPGGIALSAWSNTISACRSAATTVQYQLLEALVTLRVRAPSAPSMSSGLQGRSVSAQSKLSGNETGVLALLGRAVHQVKSRISNTFKGVLQTRMSGTSAASMGSGTLVARLLGRARTHVKSLSGVTFGMALLGRVTTRTKGQSPAPWKVVLEAILKLQSAARFSKPVQPLLAASVTQAKSVANAVFAASLAGRSVEMTKSRASQTLTTALEVLVAITGGAWLQSITYQPLAAVMRMASAIRPNGTWTGVLRGRAQSQERIKGASVQVGVLTLTMVTQTKAQPAQNATAGLVGTSTNRAASRVSPVWTGVLQSMAKTAASVRTAFTYPFGLALVGSIVNRTKAWFYNPPPKIDPKRVIRANQRQRNVMMSQSQPLQPAIDVGEIETITFDFGLLLPTGGFIASITDVSCSVVGNPLADPTPSLRLIGTAAIVTALPKPSGSGLSQAAVAQRVGNMVGGVTYLLQCKVQTSDAQTLVLWAHLQCITPS